MFATRLRLLITSSLLLLYGHACPETHKPSYQPDGCEWKEKTGDDGCKIFEVECSKDAPTNLDCLLPSAAGTCQTHITKFYFDPHVGKCSPFVYSGCDGNNNRFPSRDECNAVCLEHKERTTPEEIVIGKAESDTPNITCSGANEEVFKCGACDSHCNQPVRACPLLCRAPECGCADGFVRNRKERCVKPEQCNVDTAEPAKPTCATILCTTGTECRDGKCIKVQDQDPCAAILCAPNSSCVKGTCVKDQQDEKPAGGQKPSNPNCRKYRLATPPDGCGFKYETDDKGCDVPKLRCEGLNCTANEEVKICGVSCEDTCEHQCGDPEEICSKPACGCIDGYVRAKDGSCVPSSTCAANPSIPQKDEHVQDEPKKCGPNEELKSCGTSCPPTCGDPSPMCTRECVVDVCQCKSGFVVSENGICIRKSACPKPQPAHKRCAKNEVFKSCGTACEPSCDNSAPSICTLQCVVDTCQCRKGFVRDSKSRKCIRKTQCPAKDASSNGGKSCSLNETFTKCGTRCEPTCKDPFPAFCTDDCVTDVCQCSQGFVRDGHKNCVLPSDCPKDPVFDAPKAAKRASKN
ncbi:hypothetical protein AAVH_00055 [Aphelenchoides avenae]|nr:hypothetical protein AAVH_00055 [Aphelenchus avenae]